MLSSTKLLRIQLILLFLLATLSCIYFYSGHLPDHMFEISSRSEDSNIIFYFVTSFIASIGAYIGPWIFLPFVLVAYFYSFTFSKRESGKDIFAPFFLALTSLAICFILVPRLLGEGLRFHLQTLDYSLVFGGMLLGILGLVWIIGTEKVKNSSTGLLSGIKGLNEKRKASAFSLRRGGSEKSVSARKPLASPFAHDAQKAEGATSESNSLVPMKIQNFLYKEKQTETKPFQQEDIRKVSEKSLFPKKIPKEPRKNINSSDLIQTLTSSKNSNTNGPSGLYFQQIKECIEEKIGEFKINALIVNVLKGPVVDTFELELGPGVKVSKVNSIQEDLSLALSGVPIRIVYPMKGRTTVGIEVPRNPRETIFLHDVLADTTFLETNKILPLAMGKDAFGEVTIVDLAKMPHMLVAGATGAGKSVFINTVLVSLLVKLPPEQLKLILIDPKQLELALYQDLPHLVLPVVTEPKSASLALLWCVQEMERRYTILKEMGVRNIEGFNKKVESASPDQLAKISHLYEDHDVKGFKLPYLVVVVDEFADLIKTKMGKEIENNICRLAAKARASGIHLIIATQRPSVDVITGLIKSNFPTRVSFRVTAAVDSRTILGQVGGEKLLGNGDMLYKQVGDTRRLHSAYVDEREIEALVDKIGNSEPEFDESAVRFLENEGDVDDLNSEGRVSFGGDSGGDGDAKLEAAIQVVVEYGKASASMLQRRLGVGYNRAANLIEIMEEKGIVGPAQGSKPREVLLKPNDLG